MVKRNYKLSVQENSSFCVPAVFQAIIRKYGFELSQKEIAQEIGLRPAPEFVQLHDCCDFFQKRRLRLTSYHFDEVPDRDQELFIQWAFEKDFDVIVGYNLGRGPHTCLALDFLNFNLILQDPENLAEVSVNIYELERKMWQDRIGVYGLVGKL